MFGVSDKWNTMYLCIVCITVVCFGVIKCQPDLYDDCDYTKCFDDNGNECSNRGDCICDICQCYLPFYGPLCSEQPEDLCTKYRDCTRCKAYGLGPLSPEDCTECDETATFEIVENITFDDILPCIFIDDDTGCLEYFQVTSFPNDTVSIVATRDLKCTDTHTEWPSDRARGDTELERMYPTTDYFPDFPTNTENMKTENMDSKETEPKTSNTKDKASKNDKAASVSSSKDSDDSGARTINRFTYLVPFTCVMSIVLCLKL